jgi:uncharacterized protein YegL
MPKLMDPNMVTETISGLGGYHFSAVRTDRLGASEYTLVTIAVDKSTSVSLFRDTLIDCLKKAVDACRKSPRASNIMIRVITFADDVEEIHGFKPLSEIDTALYDAISVGGVTALYDACASAIGASTDYGRTLNDQDFGVNGILFVITDGADNNSKFTPTTVRQKADEAISGEILESFISVLVGVNALQYKTLHEDFKNQANLTQYIDAGDATPGNMAKLAAFVSRSVSSQASSQGTGQAASFTF